MNHVRVEVEKNIKSAVVRIYKAVIEKVKLLLYVKSTR
jgi:hypothetical protein